MWGCSSWATVCASRRKRSARVGEGASSRSSTLTATSRRRVSSLARNTAAKPPCPSSGPTVNSSPSARNACCRRCWRSARSKPMADAKRRRGRQAALGLAGFAAVWLFGAWPPPVWWRTHDPRQTAMMRFWSARVEPSDRPAVRPTALRDIAPLLPRMVIIGEDSRFRTHHGIDVAEIADAVGVSPGTPAWATAKAAWRRRDRLRGASTITQQLAKNLYLSPSRNPLRKLKEAVTALRLEAALPKD